MSQLAEGASSGLSLRINEIFHSLQGEARFAGARCAFVRLTGCPLRCQYCDTEYAFKSGKLLSFSEIKKHIESFSVQHVCVTGGEPLAQPACLQLLTELCDAGYCVSLETSGALDISKCDSRVTIIMDIKTPDSKEHKRNLWANLAHLKSTDMLKFVICSADDYLWSKQMLTQYNLPDLAEIWFSPSYQQLAISDLADWIIRDKLPVRLQSQLHKAIWGDVAGK